MTDDDEVFGLDDELPPWAHEDEDDVPDELDEPPAPPAPAVPIP
jgi:hypothetical protein